MPESGPAGGLSRRGFLALVVAGAAAACTDDGASGTATPATSTTASRASTTASLPVPELDAAPFTLGVASGDPLTDSVILWTRLAPAPLEGGGMPDESVPVAWELASDEEFETVVASGTAVAEPVFGHSVHVDADGLEADTWYWYRFRVGGHTSPTGRTRTLPGLDTDPEQLRFAVGSCQNWQDGYYTAYPHLVADDPDLVVFLGDYIYEGGVDETKPRQHDGDEIRTLDDYRNRYALYRSDEGLQAAHATCPWIVTWDDHEVDNNYAADRDEQGTPPEEFLDRRATAYQVYYEHMPVRLDPPEGPDLEIHRSLSWGRLASFFVLDTRQYRADQACLADDLPSDIGEPCAELEDPAQTILGAEQQRWLLDGLRSSDATWDVIANQVVFSAMPLGPLVNADQWDGYPRSREAVLEVLAEADVENAVVVTGDIHASGVGDIHADFDDPSSPVVGTEFVGTSISSGGDTIELVQSLVESLPWVRYVEASRRGYMLCTVTPERFRTDYRYPLTTLEPESDIETGASFEVEAGSPGARQV